MSIRVPDKDIDLSSIKIEPVLKWHTLNCELVTPMYGGGVTSTVIDEQMPIRASSIRGQLRFWWRLLAKNKWQLGDDRTIRQLEFALWGGMGSGDTDGLASQVFLRVSDIRNLKVEPWAEYELNRNGDFKSIPTPEDWADAPYALFPAQGKKPGLPDSQAPHALAKAGLNFKLQLRFAKTMSDPQRQQVLETLRWWVNFGGLGARSRRGLGSIKAVGLDELKNVSTPLSASDVAQAGCQLVVTKTSSSNALQAWTTSVNTMQKFRQGPGVGRNKGNPRPGRSRWPEPDALRRLQNTHHANHRPEHPAGNIFPRAMFGLPIIFHFVGAGEPRDTTLNLQNTQRMSSPIILRAYFNGKNWYPSALLLPRKAPNEMTLEPINRQAIHVWRTGADELIQPIKDNGGGNPLQAFLRFFADQN